VGVLALIGSFFLTFGRGIELLNFGALIAFMGVNAAAFVRYFLHAEEKKVWNFIPPVLGFLFALLYGSVLAVRADFGRTLDDRGNHFRHLEDALVPGAAFL